MRLSFELFTMTLSTMGLRAYFQAMSLHTSPLPQGEHTRGAVLDLKCGADFELASENESSCPKRASGIAMIHGSGNKINITGGRVAVMKSGNRIQCRGRDPVGTTSALNRSRINRTGDELRAEN